MSEHIEPDFMFKLIIVGDSGVGKTNILTKFATDEVFREDSKPTIGVELAIETFIVEKWSLNTNLGHRRTRTLQSHHCSLLSFSIRSHNGL